MKDFFVQVAKKIILMAVLSSTVVVASVRNVDDKLVTRASRENAPLFQNTSVVISSESQDLDQIRQNVSFIKNQLGVFINTETAAIVLGVLKTKIDHLKDSIDLVQQKVGNIEAGNDDRVKIENFNAATLEINKNILAVDQLVDTIRTGDFPSIEGKISGVNDKVDSITEKIATLSKNLQEIKDTDLINVKKAVKLVDTKVDTVEKVVRTTATDSKLDTVITGVTTSIEVIDNAVGTINSDLIKLKDTDLPIIKKIIDGMRSKDIPEITGSISSLDKKINTVQTIIEQITVSLSIINSFINSMQIKIDSIDSQIKQSLKHNDVASSSSDFSSNTDIDNANYSIEKWLKIIYRELRKFPGY